MDEIWRTILDRVDATGANGEVAAAAVASLVLLASCFIFGGALLRGRSETPVAFSVRPPDQCQPGWSGELVDEASIKVSGSTAIQCYAPATGQFLGLVNPLTPDGIDRAIAKAAHAQRQWAKSSFAERRRLMRSLLRFVLDNQEPIVRAACLDSGKTRVDAMLGEVMMTTEKLQWTIDHGEKSLQSETRPRNFLMFYKHNEVHYEPLGVVAACVSWK
ncbi:MAG: aldehyde dehydrogenase family protein [Terriglobus roseus]|nr:aldehyde dehydrogenase family protein [Terriglobus roseus]